jgi:hypothetical protein
MALVPHCDLIPAGKVIITDCSNQKPYLAAISEAAKHVLVCNGVPPPDDTAVCMIDPTSTALAGYITDFPNAALGCTYKMTSYDLYNAIGKRAVADFCSGGMDYVNGTAMSDLTSVTHTAGNVFLAIVPIIAIMCVAHVMTKHGFNNAMIECGCLPVGKSLDRPSREPAPEHLHFNA